MSDRKETLCAICKKRPARRDRDSRVADCCAKCRQQYVAPPPPPPTRRRNA